MGLLGNFSGSLDADGLMQGAKLGANLAGVWQSSYDESYDRQRRDSARDAFGKAWASGDQGAVDRVMQQFPEFAQEAQKFIGIRDEQHRKDLGSLMSKISAMAQSGDYQGILSLVDKNGRVLDADSSALLKNAANAAIHADDKTSAAAKQALMQSTDAIARVALTPQELSLEQFRQRQQEETERRDREAHEDRIRGQNITDSRIRSNQARIGGGNADHTKGMRGQALAKYIVENGVMPDGTRPQTSDFDWAERATGLKKTTGSKGGSGGFGAGQSPSDNLLQHDMDYLESMINSSPDSVSPIVGYTGGIGSPATGADAATKYREANGDPEARKVFSAVKRIQGAMQNKGIQAARDMGASGINTESEAERFFQAMPQLDFSSIDSLHDSLMAISDYVHNYTPENLNGDIESSDDEGKTVDFRSLKK
ncbi:phage DNA ejection protein [Citrobacter arsenatis]|uniref:phage DNA ejection protein n=1 Tax=Citrobacter arsenatis TaxID=2546350 RepID=UPI00300E530A